MSEKYFVGLDVVSSSNNGKYKPVSRVTLMVDNSKAITAGDDTGYEIIADCPHATQAMVDSLLASFKGHEYQAYSAGDANIDPSAELGDGITVSGIYSVLSRMRDDGSGFPSVEAPGKAEDEDEYPSGGPMTQAFNRELAQARSFISKTAEEIRLEVSKKVGESEVKSLISTAVGTIQLSVSSAKGSTTFTLTDQNAELSTQTLNLSVPAVNIFGQLTADKIDATDLHVNAANVKGTLTAAKISASRITGGAFVAENFTLEGLLQLDGYFWDSDYQDWLLDVGGYVGATTGSSNGEGTIGACLTDWSMSNFFIATDAGARMSYSGQHEIYCASVGCRSTSEIIVGSDERLKNNIIYDMSQEEKVFPYLKPCKFSYKKDSKQMTHWGFVAQDMLKGVVAAGIADDTLHVLSKDDTGMYGIAYGEITALNTHMIQRLMSRVEALENRLES